MKLSELLRDVAVTVMAASPSTEIREVRYDSRAVKPGDLFVAVPGFQSDGHQFIQQAVDAGAAALLCQTPPNMDVPYVLTPDSRRALAWTSAAYFGYPSRMLTVIGVTGTNGKTTTTILIKHMLEECLGVKVGLVGTISNWIGQQELPTKRTTPESYELQKLFRQMADAGCTHVVMEVSSHALSLGRVAGVQFQAGIFTNLTQDHLDFHKTMENYAAAKALLFRQCVAGAVNADDHWSDYMCAHAVCPMIRFSASGKNADILAKNVLSSSSSVEFDAVGGEEQTRVHLGIPGAFSVSNALAVLAAGKLLGISLRDAAASLSTAGGVKGRMEVVPTPGDFVVVIDYAHTPDALEKVLRTLKAVSRGRVVALFGCGGDRDRTKRPEMGSIAAREADFSVVTSDNPRTEDPEAIIADILAGMPEDAPRMVITDRPTAIRWALDHHESGDVIVLAGKGHETYQEVQGEEHHMDEREIVAEHIREMEWKVW